MDFRINDYSFTNVNRINLVLGKNGCGKSSILKFLDKYYPNKDGDNVQVRYITPERSGYLKYNSSIEGNFINNSKTWAEEQLRRNQYSNFKEQTLIQYRKLEKSMLREIETDPILRQDLNYTFDSHILEINKLLENVLVKRNDNDFDVYDKSKQEIIPIENISSGESELITLAIECLYFTRRPTNNSVNLLLLDEPDVHLHPDLQVKFAQFILNLTQKHNFIVFISTHSTAFLSGFINSDIARFVFMTKNQTSFEFRQISEVYKRILPIFGAHPLSNIFNEMPVLLVEGEDDWRIWQQAVRTSETNLRIYPCSVDSITLLNQYEKEIQNIISSLYDKPIAYSLRDRDQTDGIIDDMSPVIRFRLQCYNAENLLLTDEVLHLLNITWDELKLNIENWLAESKNLEKKYFDEVLRFKESNYDRKNYNIKNIRNIILAETGTNKSWEVAIGQAIGKLSKNEIQIDFSENKLSNFLGKKIIQHLFSDSIKQTNGS